jgi:hypothetical protein
VFTFAAIPTIAWQRVSKSFEAITGFRRYVTLLTGESPQRVGGARVLGNFFPTFEARPQLGRTIEPYDDEPGRQFVVVISDALWTAETHCLQAFVCRSHGGIDVVFDAGLARHASRL